MRQVADPGDALNKGYEQDMQKPLKPLEPDKDQESEGNFQEYQTVTQKPLKDLLAAALIGDATQRLHKDAFMLGCRDKLVESLKATDGTGIPMVKSVVDIIDDYLRRSKSER